jgi:hypothetical protein
MALVDEYDLEKRRGHVLRGIEGRLDHEKAVTAPPTGLVACTEKEKKGEWEFGPGVRRRRLRRSTWRGQRRSW